MKLIKREDNEHRVVNNLGIFAASLLVTTSAIYLYSPVTSSHAESEITAKVGAVINPVASLTLDTSNLSFVITPTETGTFDSKTVNATVSTNSTGGYELYFSSSDDETDMINSNTNIQDVISSGFNDVVSSSTMTANTWGYSLDGTDFSKIPAQSSQVTIKNIDHYPAENELVTPVAIGMKISTDLPSGQYSKDVVFSVLAHETPVPPTMQNFSCTDVPLNGSTTLIDTRDENSYNVFRSNDGNCWMAESLRLNGLTITSEDSDISVDSYVVPDNNWATSGNANAKLSSPYVYVHSEDESVYYNYVAATAGTIIGNPNTTEATSSICPKGWKLPSASDWSSFISSNEITNDAAGAQIAMGQPYNFKLTSLISYGATILPASNMGSVGKYWLSTSHNNTARRIIEVSNGDVPETAYNSRYDGLPIRCMARL